MYLFLWSNKTSELVITTKWFCRAIFLAVTRLIFLMKINFVGSCWFSPKSLFHVTNSNCLFSYNFIKSNKYFSWFNQILFDLPKDLCSVKKMIPILSRQEKNYIYLKKRSKKIVWLHKFQQNCCFHQNKIIFEIKILFIPLNNFIRIIETKNIHFF